ncbi:biotin carboxyl carrier protein of acetyl-CoA carboxylase-like [Brassica napus]|uniref:biotin carboxyl carrier protein of acetyl-CoA carboxylase-like n=1 Tax=Brassica napus TaxID=3708 RepID=UPI0020785425|nr:biotin carboxyl carrier protein of acetyl-CoA carboxylase-like [Brassica napus]
MASCSLGVPKIKISAVDVSRLRSGSLQIPYSQRSLFVQRQVKYLSLRTSVGSLKALQVSTVTAAETAASAEVEDAEKTKSSPLNAQLVPKPSEVEALVTEICDSSSIAEFELKLGGFRLYVARNLADNNISPPQPQPIPAAFSAANETAGSNGSASSTSLAITKPASSAADQGLIILQSPKVGFFRRSKTIKGKRTPSSCKEKDQVKEGQVLCYIEQLGGQFPIESDVTGEVVKILREDGEPVGYNDALISILPSFPGIKKLQ